LLLGWWLIQSWDAYEIGLFAVYWIVQTKESWNEEVIQSGPG
jgi:hypothetical protein